MTLRQNAFTAATATVLIFALAPAASAAIDGDAVVEALAAQMKKQGLELTVDSTEVRDDDIVISNLMIAVPGGDDGFKIDKVLLEEVVETGTGSYVIGRVGLPSFSQRDDDWSVDFDGASIEGYYLAGPEETDPIAAVGIYRAMEVGPLEVAHNGNTVFKMDGITSTMSPYESGSTLEMEGEVKDFLIDFSQIPQQNVQATMAEVGFPQLQGRMSASGTWDTDTGDLTVEEKLILDDAAALNIDFAIGGYTPQLIAAMQEMQKNMEGQSEEAMGVAMLGLMQQLEIGHVTVELVDDSATNKLLDFAASKQGTNRAGVVAMAKGTLPIALAQLQNPQFAAKVTAAISEFLDKPGSLTLMASPPSPVPVAQIMGSAMSAPQSVIGILGIDITANE